MQSNDNEKNRKNNDKKLKEVNFTTINPKTLQGKKALELIKKLLQDFISDYEKAEKDFKKQEDQKFHDFVRKGTKYIEGKQINTIQKGEKYSESVDDSNKIEKEYSFEAECRNWKYKDWNIDNFSLLKILTVNLFLRSKGLSKLDLGQLLSGQVKFDPEIAQKLAKLPESYIKDVKADLENYIGLQEQKVYQSLFSTLLDFRRDIEEIIRNDQPDKIKKLHDQISIIFRWYVTTFSKGRAIIYIKAKYWNGAHREIEFNRSRATNEFTSNSSSENNHNADLECFFEQLKQFNDESIDKAHYPEWIIEIFKANGGDLEKYKPDLEKKLNQGDNWAKTPVYLTPDGQITEGNTDEWKGQKRSLAYQAIFERKNIAKSGFRTKEAEYLYGCLNEKNPMASETDESGYAIPLFSLDRRSIVGAVMVVSNDAEAFTEEGYNYYQQQLQDNKYKGLTDSFEYALIDEIANLTQLCLHNIYKTRSQVYNMITVLDQDKYFPSVVFDILYHNAQVNSLLYPENKDKKASEQIQRELLNAVVSYEEQQSFYYSKNDKQVDPLKKLTAIYERVLSDHKQEINMRFGAAAKICFEQLQILKGKNSQRPIMRNMIEVRMKIEKEGLDLAKKSFLDEEQILPPAMMDEYLGPLYRQAKGIQDFLDVIEPIFIASSDLSTHQERKNNVIKNIEPFLSSLHYLRSMERISKIEKSQIESIKKIYRDIINYSIDEAYTNNKEPLKQFVYCLQTHFHVTLHMLSTMELLPYAAMFSILATSTLDHVDSKKFESHSSSNEHQAILDQLESLYDGTNRNADPATEAEKHIQSLIDRQIVDLDAFLPRHWDLYPNYLK